MMPLRFSLHWDGATPYTVLVSIYAEDGTVAVSHGGVEIGQGINTKVSLPPSLSFSFSFFFSSSLSSFLSLSLCLSLSLPSPVLSVPSLTKLSLSTPGCTGSSKNTRYSIGDGEDQVIHDPNQP